MRTLSRRELTAALAARQLLLERSRLAPAAAIAQLTPLQGQHPPAPYIGLAARLEGFARADLEAALAARTVVKTTIMRQTLHLAAAADYPAYAQMTRQTRMRTWRREYAHLDEERVIAELTAFFASPRDNTAIREQARRYDGVPEFAWAGVLFVRTLLPLVQLPPAGAWADRGRGARFVIDPRPLPSPADAAAHVIRRYLAAFGPASRRDIASWAGVAQADFRAGLSQVRTVSFRDERGTELLDLPDQPLPPASVRLPVRLLGHWDQALLAYADRERITPPEVAPLQLTISGDPTVTVDGRVAASWAMERSDDLVRVAVTPHVELSQRARASIRGEARRTARVCEPGVRAEVVGV